MANVTFHTHTVPLLGGFRLVITLRKLCKRISHLVIGEAHIDIFWTASKILCIISVRDKIFGMTNQQRHKLTNLSIYHK